MKWIFAVLMGLVSVGANASTMGTADNLNYIIVLKADVSVRECAKVICKVARAYGGHSCRIVGENLGIMSANLSTYAADLILKNECVDSMEVEGVMEGQPRVGRSN